MTPGPHSTIPIHHQDEHDPKKLIGYVREQIIEHPDMPRMTEELAKETRKALSEVFSNIFRHAESHIGGLALGQVYPNKKQFQLCVCDAGLGLVNRVQGAGHGRSSPTDAIRWALEKGNSTWTGPEPPGLGLYLLREFVKVNGGVFRIYANQGWYEEDSGRPQEGTLSAPFPGTLVELRLNVRHDVRYGLEYR
jgi:anti-sigma regulatory factor (Ser/Thr protein kinase)